MAESLLVLEHLTKRFDSNLILDDISLTVHRGEVIVVVGPSGCGKSTLLRCINALEPIQGGTIKLEGETVDPKSKTLTSLRQKIGMVFQSYELFPHLTVLDNILLAPTKVQKRDKKEVKQEALELLKRVGLEEKADSYPRQLSGGQKQRVAIARALMRNPSILLADEPVASLDPVTGRQILCLLRDIQRQRGVSILMNSHNLDLSLEFSTHIVGMNRGRVVFDGAPGDVTEAVLRDIYGEAAAV